MLLIHDDVDLMVNGRVRRAGVPFEGHEGLLEMVDGLRAHEDDAHEGGTDPGEGEGEGSTVENLGNGWFEYAGKKYRKKDLPQEALDQME